ncbi:transketolase family protein [Anaerobium acetethylicum]|uniref:Transketolase n=1 Tax=Anaerobium acetethylicum TaxID=1619234 RepID=A0A1D3TW21_9FIRM|nr:transketolase C-terminal domain-containing protein [Anaerobium acetethylicum]SCP98406.1 transketolase [Anaerobium acetethylicum]
MSITDPREAFAKALEEIGDNNDKVLAVSCDSASGSGYSPFISKYPDRYVEVGISEQTGVDISVGLAVNGFIPVISAIAPFLSMRAYEQVRNDVGYSNTNVKLIGSSSGLSHSPAGSSHQANEDMALMRTVPNMVVINPGDCYEIAMSLKKAVEYEGPVYIRMPRHPLEDILPIEERDFEIGKAEEICDGKSGITVIASGTVSNEAKRAVEELNKEGISCGMINVHTVQPLDQEMILKHASKTKLMFTVEEHSIIGGLGDAVAATITQLEGAPRLVKLGILPGAVNTGPYRELLAAYGLTHEKIKESIKKEM